jgi:hypothetical protein
MNVDILFTIAVACKKYLLIFYLDYSRRSRTGQRKEKKRKKEKKKWRHKSDIYTEFSSYIFFYNFELSQAEMSFWLRLKEQLRITEKRRELQS